MFKSKFKDRGEAQEYYLDKAKNGKCTEAFKHHYANIISTLPYPNSNIDIVKPVQLETHTAIPFEQDLSVASNEIVIDNGLVLISG